MNGRSDVAPDRPGELELHLVLESQTLDGARDAHFERLPGLLVHAPPPLALAVAVERVS